MFTIDPGIPPLHANALDVRSSARPRMESLAHGRTGVKPDRLSVVADDVPSLSMERRASAALRTVDGACYRLDTPQTCAGLPDAAMDSAENDFGTNGQAVQRAVGIAG